MKYSLYSSKDKIPENATELHLVRPIKAKKLIELMQKKSIAKISMGGTTFKRIDSTAKDFAEKNGISFEVIPSRGRAIGLGLEKTREIINLYRDDKSFREIEKLTGIPKSTAHYLVKKSKRKKIKNNKDIIYMG